MQTNYPSSHLPGDVVFEADTPFSLSRYTHAMRRYRGVIGLCLLAVAAGYFLIATALYLFGPAERVTAQPFRLDFQGAGQGLYPNNTKFTAAEIVSTPILSRVWQENHLGDYLDYGEFSRSVYILETNREYERLAAEYEAKLADTKLTPIDRERIQNEFDQKVRSIAKSEYSISFMRHVRTKEVPDALARKVVLSILEDWADFAVNQQHVFTYEVSVLSPQILTPTPIEQSDIIAAVEVLRAKVQRVLANIRTIAKLPGATLARPPQDHLSLDEIRMHLNDIQRFRLEPLLAAAVHTPALVGDRAATMRFLESQLAYDQQQLDASQKVADFTRESLLMYEQPTAAERAQSLGPTRSAAEGSKGSEAVTPQLSDTFLDRLVTLSGRAADAQYRQQLVDAYRSAMTNTIPLKEAVAQDQELLKEVQKPSGGATALDAAAARAQIEQARAEVGQLMVKTNELFQIISNNMTPSTQLYTLTAPPTTRVLRAYSLPRLALFGLLLLLLSLPVILAGVLIHNRVREEEAAEVYSAPPQQREVATAETLP